jgi:hypothetical protein
LPFSAEEESEILTILKEKLDVDIRERIRKRREEQEKAMKQEVEERSRKEAEAKRTVSAILLEEFNPQIDDWRCNPRVRIVNWCDALPCGHRLTYFPRPKITYSTIVREQIIDGRLLSAVVKKVAEGFLKSRGDIKREILSEFPPEFEVFCGYVNCGQSVKLRLLPK